MGLRESCWIEVMSAGWMGWGCSMAYGWWSRRRSFGVDGGARVYEGGDGAGGGECWHKVTLAWVSTRSLE